MQRAMWILWPSFLVAGCAVGLFFTLFDPMDIMIFGEPVHISRLGAYSIGFFGFWGVGVASSALTTLLARSPFEVNRCPLPPVQRPEGCPKREDGPNCEC